MSGPRKYAAKTPGRPFEPGNPGRPKGSRHKVTLAVEALLEGEADALTRKAIELAKAGDMTALRLCLDRIAPPRRDRPTPFELPEIHGLADHPAAVAAIIRAVADGELAPVEGEAVVRMMTEYRKSIEVADLAARIEALEERL